MDKERLDAWKILFRRALEIIDAVAASSTRYDDWSFGGGTVLMRRFRTIPNHDPLRVGTLAAILGDVAAHHALERDVLPERLFGRQQPATENGVCPYFPCFARNRSS